MAEDSARELPNLRLEDALQFVHLYAERGIAESEKAVMARPQRNALGGKADHTWTGEARVRL